MIKMKPVVFTPLDTVDGIRNALQQAIMLEHSTIPPYLYSLYSIRGGLNTSIQRIIASVVMEEMLHMALACNILNAIGGAPNIDQPGFIPSYPGPLPGAVESSLIVSLAPFSLYHLKQVFMEIEEPENLLDFPGGTAPPSDAPPAPAPGLGPQYTIGDFYTRIMETINKAGASIFTGDPARQVTYEYWPDLKAIGTCDDAIEAIKVIIDQGEGTSTSPLEQENTPQPQRKDDLAHYYRFAEIYYGKTLVPVPNPPPNTPPNQLYVYAGPPIPFDPAGVYPSVTNPKVSQYPAGSKARYGCETFNYTYTVLLKSLHSTFNGQPDQLYTAIGLMESLKDQVKDLMATDLGNGTTAGPSFEYSPTNPPANGPA
ncbi:MAG TPA: ferritin-like protein [Chloroflexia bacterium]|jgi:hypothetical protein